MKEYCVDVTEKLRSEVYVEAENEDEAYRLAMKELAKDFCAPYHYECDVMGFTVEETAET